MATRGTGKTLEELEKEELTKGMADVNTAISNRKAVDDDYLSNYNTTVDNQVATVTGQYQQDIDNAGSLYREQFNANAIAELVNQKKVEERMTNMGLTDSGLNRTQQTALAVQRGNADAATRKSMREYVNELEKAINETVAEGEAKKASEANSVSQAFKEWQNNLTLAAQQTAAANALSRYTAQEEALDAKYIADIAAEQEAERQAMLAALAAEQDNKKASEQNGDNDQDQDVNTINNIDSHKRAATVHEQNTHGNVSTAYIVAYEDCREYVKNGASRSQISTYLRKAYQEGKINKSQYDNLKKIYLPSTSGGRYAY